MKWRQGNGVAPPEIRYSMQAYRERGLVLLLPSRDGYFSSRQKDWDKRERSEADVNGSGSPVPRRDIMVQTAEQPSLQKKKASQRQLKTQDGQIVCCYEQKKEAHKIERENFDIGQNAAIERRGYGRVYSAGVHREVADLRGRACTA